MKKIFFTGGGTGGHVFPGLSIIEELKKGPPIEIMWIGSKKGMEEDIVKRAGVAYLGIFSGKLRRYFSLRNFIDLFKIFFGFIESFFLMLMQKPDLVFSKGGYVTVPPVIAAKILGIPVFTHESDMDPGLATKINSRFVQKIFIAYEESKKYYANNLQEKLVVSGNPIRSGLKKADGNKGRSFARVPEGWDKPILLFIGGSSGALQINELLAETVEELSKKYYIIHQTGQHSVDTPKVENYFAVDFIHEEIFDVIKGADLVISRAGAGSLWEISSLGKPSLLIPLGTEGSRGDQLRNAELFQDLGCSQVLAPGEASAENMVKKIYNIIEDFELRSKMEEAAQRIAAIDAAAGIAEKIKQEVFR